jgi:hypothetical protein
MGLDCSPAALCNPSWLLPSSTRVLWCLSEVNLSPQDIGADIVQCQVACCPCMGQRTYPITHGLYQGMGPFEGPVLWFVPSFDHFFFDRGSSSNLGGPTRRSALALVGAEPPQVSFEASSLVLNHTQISVRFDPLISSPRALGRWGRARSFERDTLCYGGQNVGRVMHHCETHLVRHRVRPRVAF